MVEGVALQQAANKEEGQEQLSETPDPDQEQLIRQAEELRLKREAERAQLTKNQLRKARKKLTRLYQKAAGGSRQQLDGATTSGHDCAYEGEERLPSTAMGPAFSDFTEVSVNAATATGPALLVEEVTLTTHVTRLETATVSAYPMGAGDAPSLVPNTADGISTAQTEPTAGQVAEQLIPVGNQLLAPMPMPAPQTLLPRQKLAAARAAAARQRGAAGRGRGCQVDMSTMVHMLSGRVPAAPGSGPIPHLSAAAAPAQHSVSVSVTQAAEEPADVPVNSTHARSRFHAPPGTGVVGALMDTNQTTDPKVVQPAQTAPSQEAAGNEHAGRPNNKRKKQQAIYGNYHGYYGYRHASVDAFDDDPRLALLRHDWFAGRHMLDVGCNEGLVTLAVALRFGPASTTGVDIDHALIHKARRNLKTLRFNVTQQLRTGPARSWRPGGATVAPAPQLSADLQSQPQAQQQDSVGCPHGSQPTHAAIEAASTAVVEKTSTAVVEETSTAEGGLHCVLLAKRQQLMGYRPAGIADAGLEGAGLFQRNNSQQSPQHQADTGTAADYPQVVKHAGEDTCTLQVAATVDVPSTAQPVTGMQAEPVAVHSAVPVAVPAAVHPTQQQGGIQGRATAACNNRSGQTLLPSTSATASDKAGFAAGAGVKLRSQVSGWASLRTAARALSAVNFIQQDWANDEQTAAPARSSQTDNSLSRVEQRKRFGVIMCLSVTKWVHVNWGDEGLLRLFHKFHASLEQGGYLVLEPQPWRSYKAALVKKHSSGVAAGDLASLKLRPEGFVQLLTEGLGLRLLADLNQQSSAVGFDRPMYVFQKPAAGQAQPAIPRSLPSTSHTGPVRSHSSVIAAGSKKRPASPLGKGSEAAAQPAAAKQTCTAEGLEDASHSTMVGPEWQVASTNLDSSQQHARRKRWHAGPASSRLLAEQHVSGQQQGQEEQGGQQQQQQQSVLVNVQQRAHTASLQQQRGHVDGVTCQDQVHQEQVAVDVGSAAVKQQATGAMPAAAGAGSTPSCSRGSNASIGSRKRSRSSWERSYRRQCKPEDLLLGEDNDSAGELA